MKNNRRKAWKAKRKKMRKQDDAMARHANKPDGGCFHSHYSIRVKKHEAKLLQKEARENTSTCKTRVASAEEIEQMLVEMEKRKYRDE